MHNPKLDFLSTKTKTKSYTFGRENSKKNKKQSDSTNATPNTVGPNTYVPNFEQSSTLKGNPAIRFSKQRRFSNQLNQKSLEYSNFINYSSFGLQFKSIKKTEPRVIVGKLKKFSSVEVCQFEKRTKLNLPHAIY